MIPRVKSQAQRQAEREAKELSISLPLTRRVLAHSQNTATT